AGADANVANDAGATALMWAVPDADKVQRLLVHGANPNAKSLDGRTPLMIAAGIRESERAVQMLLDAKADPNVTSTDGTTPLSQAAYINNPAVFERLVAAGASLETAGPNALYLAIQFGCVKCTERLLAPDALPKGMLTPAAGLLSPPSGDATAI